MQTKTPMEKFSGDLAYELFMSDEPHPLHLLLTQWRGHDIVGDPFFILDVIDCYNNMIQQCHDGRYAGKIRGYHEK